MHLQVDPYQKGPDPPGKKVQFRQVKRSRNQVKMYRSESLHLTSEISDTSGFICHNFGKQDQGVKRGGVRWLSQNRSIKFVFYFKNVYSYIINHPYNVRHSKLNILGANNEKEQGLKKLYIKFNK